MEILIRILRISGIIFLAIAIIASATIYFSGPKLPDDIDVTIDELLQSDLPELLKGNTGFVRSGETRIWYESIGQNRSTKGAVLLFMGIANDALGWPQDFIDSFVDSGYQVIRYDYRGTGMSDWIQNWERNPYSLTDLATDAITILDSLEIEKVHLVGISLGGMVAQEFAIHYSHRSLTLTLMMSSGNIVDKDLPGISQDITFDLIKIGLKYGVIPTERNTIKLHVAARMILRGDADYDIDVRGTAEQVLYNLRKRKGYNPDASRQHQAAVFRSGSRYDKLKELQIPALVIHGLNDPFIPIEHSKKLASILPNAKTKWFANMGHDVPPVLYDALVKALIQNFERNPN